ncbi:hypothetical protein ACHHYP_02968 [Achlya hypogyna]|uniref:Uncharacterized protein n=1 Tax=Achlya hypogyna TaxID=1202772 RepID=A0A1V9Z590_ACHHY|nr:hypothetical protein ACHHYP_02968 [Achlya hypogyna]
MALPAGVSSHAVLEAIDRLLRATAPVSAPAKKQRPPVAAPVPLHRGHSFARTPRTPLVSKPSRLGPGAYTAVPVKKRLPGVAWRPDKPPPLPQHLHPCFASSDDSDSDAAPPPRRHPGRPAPKPGKPPPRGVGFHTISYALLEPRVRHAPLFEAAEKARAAHSRSRRRHRLVVQSYSSLRSSKGARGPPAATVQPRPTGPATFPKGRATRVRRGGPAPSLAHRQWGTAPGGLRFDVAPGREVVVCRQKRRVQLVPFNAPIEPKATLGPGSYTASAPARQRCVVNYTKAKGRSDAKVDAFGRKVTREGLEFRSVPAVAPWHRRVLGLVDMGRVVGREEDPVAEDSLALSPQYAFGKRGAKGLVPFAKQTARGDNQREHEAERLDLHVEYASVEPRVMSFPLPLAIAAACKNVPELDLDPHYEYLWANGPSLVPMSKDATARWCPVDRPEVECDLEITTPLHVQSRFKKPVCGVQMATQLPRPVQAAADDGGADYSDALKPCTRPRTVDMARDRTPRDVFRPAESGALVLEPDVVLHSRVKRVVASVLMSTQSGRESWPGKQAPMVPFAPVTSSSSRPTAMRAAPLKLRTGRSCEALRREEELQLSPKTTGLSDAHRLGKGILPMHKTTGRK